MIEQKTQIIELAVRLQEALKKAEVCNTIWETLREMFPSDQISGGFSGGPSDLVAELKDKYGNNFTPLTAISSSLPTQDSAWNIALEGRYKQYLTVLAQWKDMVTDKPAQPMEKKPQAMQRAIDDLRAMIAQPENLEKFTESKWKTLNNQLDQFQHALQEVVGVSETAAGLCKDLGISLESRSFGR